MAVPLVGLGQQHLLAEVGLADVVGRAGAVRQRQRLPVLQLGHRRVAAEGRRRNSGGQAERQRARMARKHLVPTPGFKVNSLSLSLSLSFSSFSWKRFGHLWQVRHVERRLREGAAVAVAAAAAAAVAAGVGRCRPFRRQRQRSRPRLLLLLLLWLLRRWRRLLLASS